MPAPPQPSPRDPAARSARPERVRRTEATVDPSAGPEGARLALLRIAAGSRRADAHESEAERAAEQADAPPGTAPLPTFSAGPPPRDAAPPLVHQVLRAPGEPLDAEARAGMEARFGRSFEGVRVHTDARAAESARSVGALAYTVGRHLVFGPGAYAPRTAPGRRVLAHELAHVVQQERAGAAAGAGAGPVALQRIPFGGTRDPIHQPIIDDYRRQHGLPPGGVDASGMPAGPTDAQIKYQLSEPARLGRLAGMTPWELSRASAGALAPGPGSIFTAEFADYARAARLAAAVFNQLGVTFDPDTTGPLGRAPTAQEQAILDTGLSRVLARPNVQPLLTGVGRGVPTQPGAAGPTLSGRVRIANTVLEYGIKRYQLEVTVVGLGGQNLASLDATVRQFWTQYSITPGASPTITDQERKAILLFALRTGGGNPGFYHPGDDTIYLPAGTNLLTDTAAQEVARHETGHLLSAGEPVRRAFVARYGTAFAPRFGVARYVPYWSYFNEGVTELLSRESRPAGQAPPSTTSSTSTSGGTTVTVVAGQGYDAEVRAVQRIMQDPAVGREGVLRAYFSGNIPARIFEILEQILGPPP